VSRLHARILKRNGSYIVEDLGSYNGVTVNGARIEAKAELAAGDQLGIGDYDLAFQSDVVATANTLPSPKPRSQPPPRLVVLGEPAAGAEFTLNKPALRIGRDERLDIWINHKSISHEHAEVQVSDAKVTVFDLDSANGMRVNGVSAKRAILETGDILQLGEVRFRFLPAEGAHSLVPLAAELPAAAPSSSTPRKPVVALSVIGLLLMAGAGAVLTTLRSRPGSAAPEPPAALIAQPATTEGPANTATTTFTEAPGDGDSESVSVDEPQEWERELVRARRALARGRFDRAYVIAEELPADSVLRETPEFGEIRYRYVQSHINDGERALREGDLERALLEAALVLDIQGITAKQRQEARQLSRQAKAAQGRRIVD
jgi:pSer/pThr/pTyr-binding forkhead associated (FHA) protein